MCVTHSKHSFPSTCENHNTMGMDTSRCKRFNRSSSSSHWENNWQLFEWKRLCASPLRVRKQWSQAQISRTRGFDSEPMPIEVWKILHGLLVITASCWFVQITSLCPSEGTAPIHMYKGTLRHTHNPDLRKATTLWGAVGEWMQKLLLHG